MILCTQQKKQNNKRANEEKKLKWWNKYGWTLFGNEYSVAILTDFIYFIISYWCLFVVRYVCKSEAGDWRTETGDRRPEYTLMNGMHEFRSARVLLNFMFFFFFCSLVCSGLRFKTHVFTQRHIKIVSFRPRWKWYGTANRFNTVYSYGCCMPLLCSLTLTCFLF